jgi:hypothetical protein
MDKGTKKTRKIARPISTAELHRRQTYLQIWLPFILVVIIIIAAGVYLTFLSTGYPDLGNQVVGISTIFLVIPIMLWGILFLLILSAFIYGLLKISKLLPFYSLVFRTYVYRAAYIIHLWADRSLTPITRIKEYQAGISSFIHILKYKPKE